VRLLARDHEKAKGMFGRSFEVIPGDVTDSGSLEKSIAGCSQVHISVGGQVDQLSAENVAALAPQHGVQRISYISGATVAEQNRWFPMTEQKLNAEKAIRDCGVPYTIFCPTWPLEQLPRFAMGGKPLLIGDRDLSYHWFAADDLARMVSQAYQLESAANKQLVIYGPESITMREALARYCQVFHPEVESVSLMPLEVAQATATSTGNNMLAYFANLMSYFEKVGEPGDPTQANQLLGAPTISLDEWINERNKAID
jgi:uncharacterized protein YbjT (DUF2867 family)